MKIEQHVEKYKHQFEEIEQHDERVAMSSSCKSRNHQISSSDCRSTGAGAALLVGLGDFSPKQFSA